MLVSDLLQSCSTKKRALFSRKTMSIFDVFIHKQYSFYLFKLRRAIFIYILVLLLCNQCIWIYFVTYWLECWVYRFIRFLMHMFILYQDLHKMTAGKGVILVLHGASGLSRELIKVSFNTEVRVNIYVTLFSSSGNWFFVLKFSSQCIPNYPFCVNFIFMREEVRTPKVCGLRILLAIG